MTTALRSEIASQLVASWVTAHPARKDLLRDVAADAPGAEIELLRALAKDQGPELDVLLQDRSHFARTIKQAAERLSEGGVRSDDATRGLGFLCRTMSAQRVASVSNRERGPVEYRSLREIYKHAASAPESVRSILMGRADKLLGEYYKGYAAAFPDPDERETKRALKSYLLDPEMSTYDIRLVCRNNKVVGGAHYDIVEGASSGVMAKALDAIRAGAPIPEALSDAISAESSGRPPSMLGIQYIWIDEENRFSGIGQQVIEDLAKQYGRGKHKTDALFVEVNDPRTMTEEQQKNDAIDPRIRMAFYDARGFSRLDTKYAQLPIEEGMGAVESLAFLVRGLGAEGAKRTIPAADYLGIVADYAATFPKFERDTREETLLAVFADPTFQAIVRDAARRTEIPLVPVMTGDERAELPQRAA